MGKLEYVINSASPWLIIVASPILTSIQLSRGYWLVDLTLWLVSSFNTIPKSEE